MQEFFARHDFHWDEVSPYFFDGPLLGNGLLGAVLHRQSAERGGDGRTLLWEFNRSDAIDTGLFQQEGYVWQRFGIGKIALQTRTELLRVEAHLDIWNAQVRGVLHTTSGEFPFCALMDATGPIFWLEIQAPPGEVEVSFRPDVSGVLRDFGRVDFEESAICEPLNPPARVSQHDQVLVHSQTLHSGREWTLGLASRRDQNRTLYAATLAYSQPHGQAFDAAEVLQEALLQNWDETIESHRSWWHGFHARGAQVRLDDEATERFYARQSYILGSVARPDSPMLDLIGPWYCHTVWRAVWWNLNTQCTYLPLVAANRLELIQPLEQTLWRERENLRRNAPREWQHDSLALSRASSYDLYAPLDLEDGFPFGGRETGNLLWALHALWLRYTHTLDEDFARTRLFPLLEGATNLFLHLLETGDDGLLHLPTTYSPEYAAAPDCSYDMALLRWALQSLLELDDTLALRARQAQTWRETLQKLAPLASDETGLMIGRGVRLSESHRHFSHLLGFWPLKILPLETEEQRDLLERSLRHWLGMPEALAGYSHAASAALWAQLGEGEEAARCLSKLISGPLLSKTTLYREAGLCLETPLLGLAALHEMLLQVLEGVLVLFPAVPQAWRDASFENLRAEGALLVSAWRQDGELRRFSIRSDGPRQSCCRVLLPRGDWRCDEEITEEVTSAPREENVELWISLQPGQSVEMRGGA